MNINYDKQMKKELDAFIKTNGKPSILLHSCCAPCSSYVLEYLKTMGEITLFYYNPNIKPAAEYEKRLAEQKRLIQFIHSDVGIIEGNYDCGVFSAAVAGMECEREGGERCRRCFELRLLETARTAKEQRADYFTTTLSVSPHKNAAVINGVLEAAGEKYGIKPLLADFKKQNGYTVSVSLSKKYGLYRQNYCGCTPNPRNAV